MINSYNPFPQSESTFFMLAILFQLEVKEGKDVRITSDLNNSDYAAREIIQMPEQRDPGIRVLRGR